MSRLSNKPKEFWVINTSKMNVCLADLAFTIPAGRAYNLLDSKHFYYTEEQLNKSLESGSLYKKQNKIKKCDGKPRFAPVKQKKLSKQPMFMRRKLGAQIKEPEYDELLFSDEKYAEEMTEAWEDGWDEFDDLSTPKSDK